MNDWHTKIDECGNPAVIATKMAPEMADEIERLRLAIAEAPCPRGLHTCREFVNGCSESPGCERRCWKRAALEKS